MSTIPLQKMANPINIGLLLAVMLAFNIVLLPGLIPVNSAPSIKPLDLQFAYTPQMAYESISSYSDVIRKKYIIGELTVDIIYPFFYTLFLSFSIFLIYRNKKDRNSLAIQFALVPYIILVSDLLENTGIVTMLFKYPQELISVAWGTSYFSTLKWVTVAFCFLLIIVGLLNNLRKKLIPKIDH